MFQTEMISKKVVLKMTTLQLESNKTVAVSEHVSLCNKKKK